MIRSYALAGVAAIALTVSLPQISQAQTADALLTAASQCSKLDDCISIMLKGGAARQTPVMQLGAARIADMPKPEKGNRNAARELNAKALDAIKAKDYATASTLLQQANQADPRDVEVLSNWEFALVKLGKGAEAERVALATLLIDPKRTSAWAPLGEAYDLQGKKELAVSALLVAYEFSGNREKTLSVYTSKADTEERPTMKVVFKSTVDAIQNNSPLISAQNEKEKPVAGSVIPANKPKRGKFAEIAQEVVDAELSDCANSDGDKLGYDELEGRFVHGNLAAGGVEFWLLEKGRFCSGFSGSAGDQLVIYTKSSNGKIKKSYDGYSHSTDVFGSPLAMKITLSLTGKLCGPASKLCEKTLGWDKDKDSFLFIDKSGNAISAGKDQHNGASEQTSAKNQNPLSNHNMSLTEEHKKVETSGVTAENFDAIFYSKKWERFNVPMLGCATNNISLKNGVFNFFQNNENHESSYVVEKIDRENMIIAIRIVNKIGDGGLANLAPPFERLPSSDQHYIFQIKDADHIRMAYISNMVDMKGLLSDPPVVRYTDSEEQDYNLGSCK